MLDTTLVFLGDELNPYIVTRTGTDTVQAKVTRIVDEAGKDAFDDTSLGPGWRSRQARPCPGDRAEAELIVHVTKR